MNLSYRKVLARVAALSVILLGINVPSVNGEVKSDILRQNEAYYCEEDAYEHPNLIFRSDLGNIRLIEFRSKYFKGWPPLERCHELARRGMTFE